MVEELRHVPDAEKWGDTLRWKRWKKTTRGAMSPKVKAELPFGSRFNFRQAPWRDACLSKNKWAWFLSWCRWLQHQQFVDVFKKKDIVEWIQRLVVTWSEINLTVPWPCSLVKQTHYDDINLPAIRCISYHTFPISWSVLCVLNSGPVRNNQAWWWRNEGHSRHSWSSSYNNHQSDLVTQDSIRPNSHISNDLEQWLNVVSTV